MKNAMKAHLNRIILIAAAVCALTAPREAYAIGEFSLGMNMGFTYGPNNVGADIDRINAAMEYYKNANATAKIDQVSVPYCPVFGVNARSQFNYFLFRFGWYYTQPLFPVEGSITPPGGLLKNKIRIETWQNSMPATIGIIMPLKKRTYFYLGAGGTLHHAYVKVTQSHPVQGAFDMSTINGGNPAYSSNKRDSYSGMFVAFHLLLGAEVPISDKITITTEWIHQEGMSYPLSNDGISSTGTAVKTPKRDINVRGDVLLFGVSYYIGI
jgi:hypothetical protein